MKKAGSTKMLWKSGFLMATILIITILAAFSGCVFLGTGELTNPDSAAPVQVQVIPKTTATIPQTTSQNPSIIFTSVPKIGSKDIIQGRVAAVDPADYKVVIYIYVDGWWGPKPLWDQPLTTIKSDSTWSCNIVTTPTDALATKVVAYIVPNGYAPPQLNGQQELPAEMAMIPHTMVTR